MIKIGVVGCGFVGNAISEGFKNIADIYKYDIDPQKKTHEINEILDVCDYIFICLPTPMVCAEGGDADLSIIFDFFAGIKKIKEDCVFVIKSTVPIGTTKLISEKYNIKNIVHNPEFLTAKNALYDFMHPDRIVIGGQNNFAIEKVVELYHKLFAELISFNVIPIFTMSSDESEMVKYVANAFLATKVSFFNEMRLLSDKKQMNWNRVVDGVTSDKRIGKSHSIVSSIPEEKGFSGNCFCKDINALIKSFEKEGIDPILIKSSWELNKRVRKNWDWAIFCVSKKEK